MTDPGEILSTLVGSWRGTYRLWLEPGVLHTECPTEATGVAVLGGRFTTLRYTWTVDGEGQEGEFLLAAPDDGRHLQAAWIDTWHNGSGILFCSPDGAGAVVGTYGPAEEPWRWRTAIEVTGPDAIVVTAWNITPHGDEAMATQATYERAGAGGAGA